MKQANNNSTKFTIVYKNGTTVLATENRNHTTSAIPSEKMVKGALHNLCLTNGITSFENAKACVYKNGEFAYSFDLKR